MSPELAGIVGILLLFGLFAFRMSIGLSMLAVGFLGYVYVAGASAGLAMVGIALYTTARSYVLSVIPLFILMGMFLSHSGLGHDIYQSVDTWMRHLRGGLAMATIGGCAAFAAISGSATATAATIGAVALPEMKRYNYKDSLATACVAVGGTLGILIPPSAILILYGILTEESIGKLLIAGILPGILQTVLFWVTVYLLVKRNPSLAPLRPSTAFREKLASLRKIWPVLVLFLLVMGGIYSGVSTPTEAAAIGAFGALIFSLATRRFSRKTLIESLDQTARTTAMLFLILIGAVIFSRFLAVTRIPLELSAFIAGLDVSRFVIMALILFLLLFLGCFVEGIALLMLTIPILYPLIIDLGFDGIWFGVVMIVMLNMGMVTPPVGMNVYVTAGVAKDVPLMTIFHGVIPFLIAMIVCAIFLVAFPQIATFLPSLMR